ncbi:protein-(glutamine-N5) methyltransferase, release factor-specific [Aggregatibacter actinomycetemcomitans]|uniref:Release factor glutamine methyltransferase n=2 Tax=Aggregatibacter actinomycetemcomitans TaxID=714 RepID=A0A5D0EMG9_AGGAC|nr:peptide chain release factor N(5)-glutamine methyltransferase [Aggregatibacter actinomycetemcomitans]AFI87945.1 SAM-dependent methyltransferase [Aggregatibacter actinomycetemcomitans D7S-1]KYK93694.1 N5-glutamine S-adenosyl-L-methionine-dependent methyltransferase [Aggregatibacter actinomycetemcomitans serotype d str. SA3733]AMQ94890.1 protein-(glutamine-N5) methyltransferase, release factor-specific [Aggregatibacter actinomycetemcomitans]ANU82885.1 protein-(glutamine-N5) methyltransferase, 
MNYQQWLQQAIQALNQANPSENGKTDAQVLLQFVTQKSRAFILAFGETALDEKTLEKLTALLARRLQGEPIAYILGEKEFWSLPLNVSAGTLIPRPDTEILVEKAVAIAIEKLQKCGQNSQRFRILDLGTGTGAIALALASALKSIAQKHAVQLDIIGVDLTPEVVALAKSNGAKNQLNVTFVQSRWFENVTGTFDLILSNPPYIDAHDEHLTQGDVRFEPLSALVAAEEGYADLRHIIANAPKFMRENGYLLVEHGWQQGEKVRSIFQGNFWSAVETLRDYGNNERVTLGCWAQTENK